jgi:hypothetical protein
MLRVKLFLGSSNPLPFNISIMNDFPGFLCWVGIDGYNNLTFRKVR